MSTDVFTVLVVCTGNVNRSALGAVLLERWAGWYLPAPVAAQVRVTSAGLGAPVGAKMSRRSRAIAEALGTDGSAHRAAQITERAIRAADLVLVSSSDQRDEVLRLVPAVLRSTFTIREAGRIADSLTERSAPDSVDEMRALVTSIAEKRSVRSTAHGDDDIIDPQGKGDEAFRLMVRQEVPPLARVAQSLFGMPPAEVAAYDAAAEAAEFSFGGAQRVPADTDAEADAVAGADAARPRPRGRRRA
ncbi:hypothetical protein ACFWN7_09020 [Agromyces sp. NPDC058484]|uniref:arsenate reductase/protein-tyrosine-phosphatase family protein n=1 Tax=Agromyces sp. NPDC058484 TaxID=3346524 RepID=UPI003663AABD